MTDPNAVPADELRTWLNRVSRTETAKWLMIGIGFAEGVEEAELADWYGLDLATVNDAIEKLESESLVVTIAEWEGVDFEALAGRSGLRKATIVDWFEALDSEPVERSADIIRRYSRQQTGPLLKGTKSRVHYLDYQAIQANDWDLEDEDLFEKASKANLEPSMHGRFLVRAGETILEAAENRGIAWPYACRGGACANCAVIVKEGDVAMPGQTILTDDQVQLMNVRLTCVGVPVSKELKLVMNVQHLDQLQDLRLPSPMLEAEPAL